jgi:competence protein ComEA
MKTSFISTAIFSALLLVSGLTLAATSATPAAQGAAGPVKAGTQVAPKAAAAAKAKVKLIDINSATAKELSTLPGITAEEAAKIVAGRPYGSKAWLVTKGILPEGKYPGIKDFVIAKQPFKDAAKNVAALKKKESK